MVFNDRGTNTTTSPTDCRFPQITITGNAAVTWTPPTDGIYQGISFFQARNQDMTLSLAGNGGFNIKGAFYAPDALLDIDGNGVNYIGSQFVVYRLQMRGGGTYYVNYDPAYIPRTRHLKLVE
jgi:hypothetical protein